MKKTIGGDRSGKGQTNDSFVSARSSARQVAVIQEPECIGCTLCIKACPVDAIVGTHAFMHTVIESECIGCNLCVPPCPVDCIAMVVSRTPLVDSDRIRFARQRGKRRLARLALQARQDAGAMMVQREALKKLIDRKADR